MGSHKKTETKTVVEKQTQEQHSWVMDIPGLQQKGQQAVAEGGSISPITYIPFNDQQLAAINQLQSGTDNSQLEAGAQKYVDYANKAIGNGEDYTSRGLGIFDRLANMDQDQYTNLISSYMNSDLIRRQEEQSTKDLNQQYQGGVQDLNQRATGSGMMGSSRAGVAQGVMFGKTQDAIARANLGIETSARSEAIQQAQYQIGQQMNLGGQYLSYGQNQQQQGLSAYSTGLNWYQQLRQNKLQDVNNQWTAGSLLQQNQQNVANTQAQNDYIKNNQALLQWQQLTGAFAPAAGWSTQGQSNTNTKTTTQSSGGSGIMGGIMGAVGAGIGGYFGGPIGAQVGAGLGSQIGGAM